MIFILGQLTWVLPELAVFKIDKTVLYQGITEIGVMNEMLRKASDAIYRSP